MRPGVPRDALVLAAGGPEVGQALMEDVRDRRRRLHRIDRDRQADRAHLGGRRRPADRAADRRDRRDQRDDRRFDGAAEQVVVDVVTSAFRSAGQRCSALRVLVLQEEIAQRTLDMLRGAMDTLVVGDPADPRTDVGR
jgi:RHH-type proline utilization regulon transcriptional repressor/proline dehydrogenase/delta 1-pyrroline-5-carboxylate dehydrogenase